MADTDCQQCPQLQARLIALRTTVRSIAAGIERELDEPTMSRRELIRSTQARLDMAAESEE